MNHLRILGVRLPLMSLLLVVTMPGCGSSDGPQRFDVSGKVTLNGKPVTGGSIMFTPDTDQGNSGPQGLAEIQDGTYNTARKGRGTVGGPHKVLIIATDGAPLDDSAMSGPLAEYNGAVELPKSVATHDFSIPDASEQQPVASPPTMPQE